MTHLGEIYNSCIVRLQDNKLTMQYDDELEEERVERIESVLKVYLNSAINSYNSRFKKTLKMNYETGMFENDIDDVVIEILVVRMILGYTQRRLNELNALKQSVRTKDFETHSKANELKAVESVYKLYKENADTLEANLDWRDFDFADLSG